MKKAEQIQIYDGDLIAYLWSHKGKKKNWINVNIGPNFTFITLNNN